MTIYQPTIYMKEFINIDGTPYQDTFLDSNNNIAIISDVLSVSQTVKNAISLWLGEYQFNTTRGIPWQNILGNPLNKSLLNNYLKTAILSVAYVTEVISIEYFPNNLKRTLGIRITFLNTDNITSVTNVNI
jgi:hypothetical protein